MQSWPDLSCHGRSLASATAAKLHASDQAIALMLTTRLHPTLPAGGRDAEAETAPLLPVAIGSNRPKADVQGIYERRGHSLFRRVSFKTHALDITQRRRTKQSFVFPAELRGTFVAHMIAGLACVESLIQH